MDIKMTLYEFTTILSKLHIAHIIERINNEILHVKVLKPDSVFIIKFIDKGLGFEFANFYDGCNYKVTREFYNGGN